MDDRRFDSLVKSLAGGVSRRSVLKGMLGLGGAAVIGGTQLEGPAEAARRPTPTPPAPKCPGNQTWSSTACICPPNLSQCNPNGGPACCNDQLVAPGEPGYSECCDNACCNGTCYGEELCCRINNRAGGLPPTNRICDTTSGPECCLYSDACCLVDGCCAGGCYGGSTGNDSCCPASQFCPNASGNANQCCPGGEKCCAGGTDDNSCAECCSNSDCPGATCSGGQCCKGQGQGPCNGDASDCCAGLLCVGPAGDNSCEPPEPPCIQLGQICEYGSNDCCLDDVFTQCNSVYSGKDSCPFGNDDVCCRTAFGACNDSCDCCLDLACEASACCQSTGGFCNSSDECCSGLACANDTCRSCAGLQQSCSQSEPCCDSTGQICTDGGVCVCRSGFIYCEALGACVEGQCCADADCVSVNPCLTYTCDAQRQCVGLPVVCNTVDACTAAICDPNTGCPTTSACAATGQTCCPDGACRDSCGCGGNGTICRDGGDCCGGCCIANFATYDDWLKVCTDAGLSGNAATLCAQAIVDQGYPSTCLSPNTITFPAFPDNPVTLPCFD